MSGEAWLAVGWLILAAGGWRASALQPHEAALPCSPSAVGVEGGVARCGTPAALPPRARVVLGLPVDINAAAAADLVGLPGIGPVLAERVVEYRVSHGAFRSVDDLGHVSGFGSAHLKALRGRISVGDPGVP